MNAYETWFCGTRLWRWMTRRQVLPWVLQGSVLGEHVLELGAGPGAGTVELARHAPRVTSLEYDHALALKLSTSVSRSTIHPSVSIIQGDAAALPFPDGTFSSAIAILMLHHLKSIDLQDRTFSEVRRVLRPGGVFLAFDIPNGWVHRVGHIKSTFVPLDPTTASQRLMAAGLSKVRLDSRSGGFRIRALRAE
jgi:ubiquinone/menaquinone biosynthesis C-methylase UbiE